MTSLEIAELTGKQHCHVMKAIRNMKPAWEKVNGLKFQLVEYRDQKGELCPCYQLTKTECLYIATKFNNEAHAKLVLRWEELGVVHTGDNPHVRSASWSIAAAPSGSLSLFRQQEVMTATVRTKD